MVRSEQITDDPPAVDQDALAAVQSPSLVFPYIYWSAIINSLDIDRQYDATDGTNVGESDKILVVLKR